MPAQLWPAGAGGEVFTWSGGNVNWERIICTYLCLCQQRPEKLFFPASVNHSACRGKLKSL